MNTIGISPKLNTYPQFKGGLPAVKSANFLSGEILSRIQSMESAFDYVFKNLKNAEKKSSSNFEIKEFFDKLEKEFYIKNIFDLQEKGITFVTKEKYITIAKNAFNAMKISLSKIRDGKPEGSITIKDRTYSAEGLSNINKSTLEECFDSLDFYLLKLRRKFEKMNLAEDNPIKSYSYGLFNLAGAKQVLASSQKNRVKSGENFTQLIDDIKSLRRQIFDSLRDIKNPNTHARIRYEYYAIKEKRIKSEKIMFSNVISPNEDASVNVIRNHGKDYLILQFNKDENYQNIIVCENGTVYKTKHFSDMPECGRKKSLYTPEELKSPELLQKIGKFKEELKKYLDYINDRKVQLEKKKHMSLTTQIGEFKPEIAEIMSGLENKFKMTRYILAKQRGRILGNRLRKKYDITSVKGSHVVRFKHLTDENEEVRLYYTVFDGGKIIKFLVVDGDGKVKKTFIVQDNKLVKFEANKLKSKMHSKRIFNYYSQEEIDNSSLYGIIKKINNRINAFISEYDLSNQK